MKLILASTSPRRKEILNRYGYNFEVIPSSFEENLCDKEFSKEIVENCAYNKAISVLNQIEKNSLIISADTVVVLNNKILGKPKDENNSFNMLLNLSGKIHFVATSICLINTKNNKTLKDTDITYVKFRNLSKSEIKNYIKTFRPYDKAGSYGIQDEGFDFAVNTKGEIDNVIGFPIKLFKKMLLFIQ